MRVLPTTLLRCLLLLLAAPLRALQEPGGEDAARSADAARAFQSWNAQNGGNWLLRLEPRTGAGRLLWGATREAPFRAAADREYVALAEMALDELFDVFRIDSATLRVLAVHQLPLSRIGSSDKVAVELAQETRGLRVVGGFVTVLFAPGGALLAVDSTALPGVEGLDTRPTLDPLTAVAAAHAEYVRLEGRRAADIGVPELLFYPYEAGKALLPRLAWALELRTPAEQGGMPSGRRIYVSADASPGIVLGNDQLVHERSWPAAGDLIGHAESWATPGTKPDTASNPEAILPMRYMQVTSPVGNDTTDANGDFLIPYGGTNPVDVTFTYTGPYARVLNSAGSEYSLTQSFTPGVPGTATMNPSRTQYVTAEANAFECIGDFLVWIWSVNPSDMMMAFQVRANVNIAATCNAYYDGQSINFYQAGGGCVNTSYSTVVAHEEGHWANDRYRSYNGSDGFGEGNSDVYAMYIYDTPIVGEDFFGPGTYVRTGENTRQFCGDSNPGCYGEVHADGEVLMGALWKVRRNLNNTLGNAAGDLIADTLHNAWMNAYNDGQIRTIIEEHWLTLDDNNGNIYDGTPNYADIDAGFREQGFPGVDLQLIQITHTPLGDTQNEYGPYTVAAQIDSLIGAGITGGSVEYRVNGGSFLTVPMANTGGNNWSADIPGQQSVAFVDYHIEAVDSLNNVARLPRTGEFSFIVGVVTQVYFNDFEGATDEGWTHGQVATQDDWQRGTPQGKSTDPNAAYSGLKCWANDLGNSGWDGQYEPNVNNHLDSPAIDLTGKTGTWMRFRRWLNVEESRYDHARIYVNQGGTWYKVFENPYTGHLLESSWTQQALDISRYADNNPALQVRFQMQSDGGLEFGGWNVDDFEIYTITEVPDTNTILLTGTTSTTVGGTVSYDISNAPPSSPWWLYASLNRNGTLINGHPFDIGTPYRTVATGTTSALGTASWSGGPVPPRAAGRTIYVEARSDAGGTTYDSNVVTLTVL